LLGIADNIDSEHTGLHARSEKYTAGPKSQKWPIWKHKIAAIVKNYYTQNTTTLKQIIMMWNNSSLHLQYTISV